MIADRAEGPAVSRAWARRYRVLRIRDRQEQELVAEIETRRECICPEECCCG